MQFRIRLVAPLLLAAFMLHACSQARAEKRPLTKAELEETASHIVVGKVQAVYSFKERVKNYGYTRYVAEVKVDKQEKGEGPKDLIYIRYFTIAWTGAGPREPGPGGHWPRPEINKSYRFYLARNVYDGFSKSGNKDGGYNVIYGNGIQPVEK